MIPFAGLFAKISKRSTKFELQANPDKGLFARASHTVVAHKQDATQSYFRTTGYN